MDAYVLLARNVVSGRGYTYAGMPTAFRTPAYPLFLATMMRLFGSYFALSARFLQGLFGLAAAYICARASGTLFSSRSAAKVTLLFVLLFPSLLYFSGEILTEGLTSFFLAVFLWTFAADATRPSWKTAGAMGCAVGMGALVRANLALLGVVAIAGAWISRSEIRSKRELALIPVCAAILVSPWILRNWTTFGQPLLSTESGAATLASLINPEARLQSGLDEKFLKAVGYVVPNDLETNDLVRLKIGPELEMNRRCWSASRELWRQMSWFDRLRWIAVKWITYWLSTDQLLHPGAISTMNRVLHVSAVFFYWVLLALAVQGWRKLRKSRPKVAVILLGYCALVTIVHTPFVMNSRIRAPLVDPIIAVLAGGVAVIPSNEDRTAEVRST